MRILYLHQYFNTPAMVGGTRSYEMARRFVASGHEVHMITSDRECQKGKRGGWRTTTVDGIHVHWYPVPYSNAFSVISRLRAFGEFAIRAGPRAARIGGDVVFATSTPLTIALPGAFAARRLRVPMVFEVRDLWPEMPISVGALRGRVPIAAARWLERFAYRHAAAVVALSEGMRDGVVRTGYALGGVHVIPNSCDLDLFARPPEEITALRQAYGWLGSRPLILYAGTLGEVNNVSYLARVAAEALGLNSEIRFVVIGTGKEEVQVRRAAAELGVLDRNFFMLPPLSKTAVATWFAAADVATSLFADIREMWANSANKFFDGLAAGKALAINYGGWQAKLISERGVGVVLPPHDYGDAARTLVRVIEDGSWCADAGRRSRKLAAEQFDRDVLANQLLEVLTVAVKSSARLAGAGRFAS